MAPHRNASSEEDDKSDSISVTSTAGSEPRDTYLVERILAESKNEADDSPIYLVKWEGYPVHRSTWEGVESFEDDAILFNWKEQQMKVTRGLTEDFNLEAFFEEQESIEQAKEERRARRRAKRIRLGLQVEPELEENSDKDDLPSKSNKANKAGKARDRAPRQKQKTSQHGYALPEDPDFVMKDAGDDQRAESDRSQPKRRRRIVYSDDEERSSSADSLMKELSISKPRPRESARQAKSMRTKQEQASGSVASTAESSVKFQPSAKGVLTDNTKQKSAAVIVRNSTISKALSKPADRTGQAVKTASVSGASHAGMVGKGSQTKAGISTAPASKKKDLGAGILSNWNTALKPRQRPRVNRETANMPGEKGFRNVSELRRFELYGRNEPAPNPEKLQFISLSGQGPSPKSTIAAGSDVQNHEDMDIVDRTNEPLDARTGCGPDSTDVPGTSHISKSVPRVRVVGFADERRNRVDTEISRSPERGEEGTPTAAPSINQASVPAAPENTENTEKAMQTSLFPPGTKSTETCPYWARGDCRLPAANCGYQHERTPIVADRKLPKFSTPPVTCYYWYQAHCKQPPSNLDCKKPADTCMYAHWDTGVSASPPGGRGSVPNPILETQSNEPLSSSTSVAKDVEVSHQNYVSRPETITSTNGPPLPKGPSSVLECYYWATRGWCTKTDEECWFAHYRTGQVAKPYNPKVIAKQTVDRNQQILSNIMESPLSPVSASSSLEPSAQVSSNPTLAARPPPFIFSAQQQSNKTPPARTTSEILNDVSVTLRIKAKDNQHIELQTRFAGFDLLSRSKFLDTAGPTPVLELEHFCLTEDFRMKFAEEKMESYAFGMVLPDSQSAEAVDMFSERLKLQGGAGVISRHNFSLIVYPVHQDAWKFLDDGKPPPTADARLRFHIFEPVQPPPETFSVASPIKGKSSYLTTLFRNILGTDMETLSCREGNEAIEKVVFIMWPPGYEDELDLIAEFLQTHEIKVYLSNIKGSWSYFLGKYATGIILIHPSIYHYWQIPRFTSVLRKGFNIFQLGVDLHSSPGYLCIRLFPHGRVVYITDDVFAHHEADALVVLKRFVSQAGKRPPGFWKIAGRPGLKDWLLELAEKHFHKDVKAKDTTRIELYSIIDKLVPPHLTDPWHPEDPSEIAPVVSLGARLFPNYAKMWEANPKEASNYMVNWFAGWACTKATEFKRFIVVHPWRNEDWLSAYKHIEVVKPAEYGDLAQGI